MRDSDEPGRPDRGPKSSWRGTDPERTETGSDNDTLESQEYPDPPTRDDPSVCVECGGAAPPYASRCEACHPMDVPDRDPSRPNSYSPRTKGDDHEWALDRVVVAVVNADMTMLAYHLAEVGLKENIDQTLALGDQTEIELVRDFDGEPPAPIGQDYHALPNITKTTTESGKQLLADVVADIDSGDEDHPQIYDEQGFPLNNWDTVDELQSQLADEPRWLVPAVITQYEQTESDALTLERGCRRCDGQTVHEFKESPVDYYEGHWVCRDCGEETKGRKQEVEHKQAMEQLENRINEMEPPDTNANRRDPADTDPEFDQEASDGYGMSDDEPPAGL